MIGRINIVLALLLVAVVVLSAVVRVDHSQPNYEIWPDMKYTPAWTTYEANPNFADGRTLQPPVENTIARGELHRKELGNPYDMDNDANPPTTDEEKEKLDEAQQRLSDSVQRGGETYRVFCISCHGPSGAGDGPISRRGLASPSLLTDKAQKLEDLKLFDIVTRGYDTETWLNSMPPFAAQISPERRWDVINYVNDLQKKAATTEAPGKQAAEPEPKGKQDAD